LIAAFFNKAVEEKAQAIIREANELPFSERERYCQDKCGLTYGYLTRIGKSFKKPSARVLMNLGYEVYVKDLATGELSLLELDVKCDWNPSNPRMNPTSMPVFVNSQSRISTTSE
jgi:hypothetical protein